VTSTDSVAVPHTIVNDLRSIFLRMLSSPSVLDNSSALHGGEQWNVYINWGINIAEGGRGVERR